MQKYAPFIPLPRRDFLPVRTGEGWGEGFVHRVHIVHQVHRASAAEQASSRTPPVPALAGHGGPAPRRGRRISQRTRSRARNMNHSGVPATATPGSPLPKFHAPPLNECADRKTGTVPLLMSPRPDCEAPNFVLAFAVNQSQKPKVETVPAFRRMGVMRVMGTMRGMTKPP
jgi:hypothetical protein